MVSLACFFRPEMDKRLQKGLPMAKRWQLLIPPRRVRLTDRRLRLGREVTLAGADEVDRLALAKTAELLAPLGRSTRCVIGPCDAPDVRVVRSRRVKNREGYRLEITPKGATVSAGTDAGAFYGLATLRELIRIHQTSLPCGVIDDAPAFPRRAVYHDCARGKVPKLKTLKALVERLAEWKINELQLYVENAFAFKKHPQIWKGWSPLTPRDITALQAHCKSHHVRLVPSLSSFGHMEKVLIQPSYAHLAELPNGWTLCPTDPASIRFVEELYGEFVPLFEAEDFNVCCDETWDLGLGRSKDLCRRVGTGQVYLSFLKKIRRLCGKFGRRMNAWADIVLEHPELLDGLPRDIVMLNWGYEAECETIGRTEELARTGLPFMVCPGTSSWGTIGSRWPNASANIRNFVAEGKRWGAEGVLNTDWGDDGHRQVLAVSLMPFAYGAAESWNPAKADVKKFPGTFAFHAFGDRSGKVGDAIEALGSTYLLNGLDTFNCDPMTYSLNQPLRPPDNDYHRTIDRYTPEALAAVLGSLPDPGVWRLPQADQFDAIAMAEYALSARIIALYCRRSHIARQLGLGQRVTARAMKELADETDLVGEVFAGLWRARNKPSRLRDNVRLFRAAAAEARKLAKT